jgi:TPR repeat protein
MNNIDSTAAGAAVSLGSFAFPRAQRRAWVSALALGTLGCFAVTWGSPSPASSTPASAATSIGSNTYAIALARSCDLANGVSCNDLGVTLLHGYGVEADARLAFRSFERACNDGSPDGCSNLGALYESGVGVTARLDEAARLYEQACKAGAALGCSNLGALYARGRGVERDEGEAKRLFTRACQTGSAAGCHNLMLVSGR